MDLEVLLSCDSPWGVCAKVLTGNKSSFVELFAWLISHSCLTFLGSCWESWWLQEDSDSWMLWYTALTSCQRIAPSHDKQRKQLPKHMGDEILFSLFVQFYRIFWSYDTICLVSIHKFCCRSDGNQTLATRFTPCSRRLGPFPLRFVFFGVGPTLGRGLNPAVYRHKTHTPASPRNSPRFKHRRTSATQRALTKVVFQKLAPSLAISAEADIFLQILPWPQKMQNCSDTWLFHQEGFLDQEEYFQCNLCSVFGRNFSIWEKSTA